MTCSDLLLQNSSIRLISPGLQMNTVLPQLQNSAFMPTTEKNSGQAFYVVAPRKFWVLYVVTFGLYGLYWSYQQWSQFRRVTGEKIWPVARSIFAIFFIHELYGEVDSRLKIKGLTMKWRPSALATATVAALIASSIASQLSSKDIGSPMMDYLSLAFIPFVAYLRYLAQLTINAVCGDPAGSGNSNWTIPNIIWIVIGVLWWLLVLIGFSLGSQSA